MTAPAPASSPSPAPPKDRAKAPHGRRTATVAGLGYLVRAIDRVWPAAGEKLLWRLFSTPERPRAPRPPQSALHRGERLSVSSPNHRPLAAWSFGEGPPVLLAHGWSGHAGQMSAFIDPLVRAGFRVVAFDQPAHGQSAGERTNMLEFRQAILALGEKLGPLAGVVAHSLGATASVLALDRGLQASRLALLAPPLDPTMFAQGFALHLGVRSERARALGTSLRNWVREDIGDRDPTTVAATLKLPALVIQDQGDRAVAPANGRELAQAWPGARLLEVSGFGHNRMLRAPEVVDAVVRFVAAEPTQSRRQPPASGPQNPGSGAAA